MPLAGLRYGLALSEGNGVKRDPVAAQRWLMQAQESGMPEAALAHGRHGGAHARLARQGSQREDRADRR